MKDIKGTLSDGRPFTFTVGPPGKPDPNVTLTMKQSEWDGIVDDIKRAYDTFGPNCTNFFQKVARGR